MLHAIGNQPLLFILFKLYSALHDYVQKIKFCFGLFRVSSIGKNFRISFVRLEGQRKRKHEKNFKVIITLQSIVELFILKVRFSNRWGKHRQQIRID